MQEAVRLSITSILNPICDVIGVMADSTPVQRNTSESSSKEVSADKKHKKDGIMERQYQETVSRRNKRPWWWWRWISCGPVKFLALVLVVPFILNYASLSREAKQLIPKGRLYSTLLTTLFSLPSALFSFVPR